MLLITETRPIAALFGHTVYAVSKTEIVALQNSTVQGNRDENRFFRFILLYLFMEYC